MRSGKNLQNFILATVILSAVIGCSAVTATSTPTSTPIPAATPTQAPTLSPTATPMPTPSSTASVIQEGLVLVPFSERGFSGVVPEGWGKTAPGVYSRDASDRDATLLVQQSIPGATIDQVKAEFLSIPRMDEFP